MYLVERFTENTVYFRKRSVILRIVNFVTRQNSHLQNQLWGYSNDWKSPHGKTLEYSRRLQKFPIGCVFEEQSFYFFVQTWVNV